MFGLDKHGGSGAEETAIRQAVPMGAAGKSLRALRRADAGRFGAAAAGAALILMIGAGHVFAARPRISVGGPNAHSVQLAAVSRTDGRLTVENEPLLRVIDELNRGAAQKVKVMDRSDPRYRKLLVTGQFRTGRPQVIIEYMRAAGIRVRVERDKNGNFLLRLAPAST